MNIICAIFGLWCVASIQHPIPSQYPIPSGTSDYEIVIHPANMDATGKTDSTDGYSQALQAALNAADIAKFIHETMPPLSDAAGWSVEGATTSVTLDIPPGTFLVSQPKPTLQATSPLTIQGDQSGSTIDGIPRDR